MTTNNATKYTVHSSNFSWHPGLESDTYEGALALAKARGFEAHIDTCGQLVAVWSPLYGTKIYNRVLAQ